jgi:hypothetical protein
VALKNSFNVFGHCQVGVLFRAALNREAAISIATDRRRPMYPSELSPRSPPPLPLGPHKGPTVIGLVDGGEFERAQVAIPGLAGCIDYDDWLDRREGLQIGLAMMGVEATIVRFDLASFLEWRRLTRAGVDESAMDAFAAVTLAMRTMSVSKVLAAISKSDFAQHSASLAAITCGRSFDRWSRYRRALRVKSETLGGRVERLPVSVEDFLAWCACLGHAASEELLDRYAQLTLERLTTPNRC